jgi:hypothetical protein
MPKAFNAAPAPDDDSHSTAPTLTAKQEAFAQAWAKTGNKAAAYRLAYTVHDRTLPNTVWANASRMAALPKIEARYKELVEQAALETVISIREALQWQLDIATANPNELTRVVLRNCRYCRGVDHGYQWKSPAEFQDAEVKALDEEAKSLPSEEGGYGFDGALEPVATCTACFGCGIPQTIVSDTTKLTGKALRLYAGVEEDRFGAIKIKTHDQDAAWERVLRMLGAFKDSLDLRTPADRAREAEGFKLGADLTEEQASKAYLALLGS